MGSDTISNTLTYLLLEVSRQQNHAVQIRLREEVISLNNFSPSLAEIDKQPYLGALVRDSLAFSRLSRSSSREVPAGGRMLDNYFLPDKFPLSNQR